MPRKAISPLWELIWSTSAYRRWHSQASTYPAGWSEFLFCFSPHTFQSPTTHQDQHRFYLCQAITYDGNRRRVAGLKQSVALWWITVIHCITGSLESIRLNCRNTQTHCMPPCCSRWPKLRPAWEETFKIGGLSRNQNIQKQTICSPTENL